METFIPIVLTISIVFLTAVFLVAGFYLVLILRQVKRSLSVVDRTLGKIESASGSVERSLAVLPKLAEELHDSAKLVGMTRVGVAAILDFFDSRGIFSGPSVKKLRTKSAPSADIEPQKNGRKRFLAKSKPSKPVARRRFFFKR